MKIYFELSFPVQGHSESIYYRPSWIYFTIWNFAFYNFCYLSYTFLKISMDYSGMERLCNWNWSLWQPASGHVEARSPDSTLLSGPMHLNYHLLPPSDRDPKGPRKGKAETYRVWPPGAVFRNWLFLGGFRRLLGIFYTHSSAFFKQG